MPDSSNTTRILDLADELTPIERASVYAIRKTFDVPALHSGVRWLQRKIGSRWVLVCTDNVRHMHGLSRLPDFDPEKSYICVANHRSFFDLYVVTAHLIQSGMHHRILFPVRSGFWYDHPLGPVVNWSMSFLAMYPPVFRKRNRALNIAGVNEVVELVNRGGTFLGMHPEGRRKLDGDPYTFLPAQPGFGRILHRTKEKSVVIPVFINGLVNSIVEQISGNYRGTVPDVHAVFGKPIDFSDLLAQDDVPETHHAIANRAMSVIADLSKEEQMIRAGTLSIP